MALNSRVRHVMREGGRASGVVLKGGGKVRARTAVVAGCTIWDAMALVSGNGSAGRDGEGGGTRGPAPGSAETSGTKWGVSESFEKTVAEAEVHDSFMHLHW